MICRSPKHFKLLAREQHCHARRTADGLEAINPCFLHEARCANSDAAGPIGGRDALWPARRYRHADRGGIGAADRRCEGRWARCSRDQVLEEAAVATERPEPEKSGEKNTASRREHHMARPYSSDLRERVVEAVNEGGNRRRICNMTGIRSSSDQPKRVAAPSD